MTDLLWQKRKNGFSDYLIDFLIIALLAIMFIVQISAIIQTHYLRLTIGIVWGLLVFINNPSFFLNKSNFFLKSFFTFSTAILIAYMLYQPTLGNRYSELALIPLWYWIYEYNSKYRGVKYNITISIIGIILIINSSIRTSIALIINPYASRLIKSAGNEDSLLMWSQGVQGYDLIYSVVIIIIVLLYLFINRKSIKLKIINQIIIFFLLILLINLVILSNYFTALIITFFGIINCLIIINKRRFIFFLIAITLIYIPLNREVNIIAIDTLSKLTQDGGKTQARLQDIKNSIQGYRDTENLNSRQESTTIGLTTFAEFPIWGSLIGKGNDFSLLEIGQHSYVLDTFSIYGIIIGSMLILILWLPFQYRLKNIYHPKLKMFSLIVGFTFFLLIIFNNLTPSMGFSAFFIFPTFFDFIGLKLNE